MSGLEFAMMAAIWAMIGILLHKVIKSASMVTRWPMGAQDA